MLPMCKEKIIKENLKTGSVFSGSLKSVLNASKSS